MVRDTLRSKVIDMVCNMSDARAVSLQRAIDNYTLHCDDARTLAVESLDVEGIEDDIAFECRRARAYALEIASILTDVQIVNIPR